MKFQQSATVLALFLSGTQAVNLSKHHSHRAQFADGVNIVGGDNFGTEITMNGPKGTESYSYAQKRSGNRFADGLNIVGGDAFGTEITMNGPAAPESYSYAQRQHNSQFADGYGDHEQFGETIKTNGMKGQDSHSYMQRRPISDTLIDMGQTYYTQVVPVPGFVGTAAASTSQAGTKGADGKGKIIEAQELEDFADGQTNMANTRLPYASTLIQTDAGYYAQEVPVPGFVAVATATAGNVDKKGAEAKAAIIDAQESEDFLNGRTELANTRLPYASTLIQTGYYSQEVPIPGFVETAAATAASVGLKGADGKEKIIEAQELEDFADGQTDMANARLPYASTLLQLDSGYYAQEVPEPGFIATAALTAANVNLKGAEAKEAIIDAQESEQFLDDRTEMANVRLPYASTLVQLNEDNLTPNEKRFLQEEENADDGMPVTVEYQSLAPTMRVPLDFHFVQERQDDDPNNLDNFALERIPMGAKL